MKRSAYSYLSKISKTNHTNPLHIALKTPCSCSLPVVYHEEYNIEPWDKQHRLNMSKSKYIFQHLQQNNFNFNNLDELYRPLIPSNDDISIAHCIEYINRLQFGDINLFQSASLPISYADRLLNRSKLLCNGTLLTCYVALKYGIGINLSGGSHHSFKDNASGYCIFNDLAYSALHLISNNESNAIRNICILDLDAHQGNGTASILQDVDNILTVSVHCESMFPWIKQQSDIDIGLEKGCNDTIYLKEINNLLTHLIDNYHQNGYPIDLIIYDSGVDIHLNDRLGGLRVSDEGIIKRNKMVLEMCLLHDIPVAIVMGGGYNKCPQTLAERHGYIYWNALEISSKYNL